MFTVLKIIMTKKAYISFLILFLSLTAIFSQETIIYQKGVSVSVRITIVDENNIKVIKNAEIEANGVPYYFPDVSGRYIVKAKVGHEIRVSHPDFETVYYTLMSSENIRIVLENYVNQRRSYSKSNTVSKKIDYYLQYLDSAKFYKKRDIVKSLSFIEKVLKNKENKNRNAATYKLLADVYLYWKQYDLAVYNYKLSNQIFKDISTKILLAKAHFLLRNYNDSEQIYQELIEEKLSSYESILVFEGLGDVFFSAKKWKASSANYQKALQVAKDNLVTPKITDLNSKIANVFAVQGKTRKAEILYRNSLSLAKKENPIRALEEEEKVANFYNANSRFDDEILLRKKSLIKAKEHKSLKRKSIEKDSITLQKINYKIGNAYILKEDYKEAIPFLQKSIKDANKNEDIVVKKDATRKLSESYATIGDYDNALKSYQDYVKLVDELYEKKEQEIQQVKRFLKKISENQNRIYSLEKDKELAQSKISLAYFDQRLSEESNRSQRQIIYSLITVISLLILLAWYMLRNNKQQKLANNLLALKSMRSQMNPHFIFNALNSVNSFIAVNDERNANRYLSEFSLLMRSVLENSDEDFIPLTKEIELLGLYIKLEHDRFKDKFDYQLNVDQEIDLVQFTIPPMLLQPYIENAIWHGLRYRKDKGVLDISINKKDEETILISIIDNGIGRKKSQKLKTKNQLKQKSKGMSTIKSRIAILNSMYKERLSLSVSDVLENGEGTKVELFLKKK
jgi:tetratricopeptide (TPR) repeat protein